MQIVEFEFKLVEFRKFKSYAKSNCFNRGRSSIECYAVCFCAYARTGPRGNGGMCVIEICHRVGDVHKPGLTWGGVSAYIDQSIGIQPAFSETSALRYISTGWQTNTRSCQALCCQSSDHKWRFCTTAWTTEQKTEPTGQSLGKIT